MNEITRLAAAVNHLRPDWPNASLVTFINRELSARPLRDAAVVLVWVACDEATDTPKRATERGPWWDAVAAGTGRAPATPDTSTLNGACRKCGLYVVRGEDHQCAKPAPPGARQRAFADVGKEASHG